MSVVNKPRLVCLIQVGVGAYAFGWKVLGDQAKRPLNGRGQFVRLRVSMV